MRFLIPIFLIFNFSLNANEYNLSWYPKDNYFDSINTPTNLKYSLINTDGVWEDNKGSYGVMNCLVSLLTKNSEETELNGLCQADDESKNEAKFWVTLKRNSLETAGVGKLRTLREQEFIKKL